MILVPHRDLVNETDPTSSLIQHDISTRATFDKFKDPTPSTLPMHLLPTRSTVSVRTAKLAKPSPHSILEEFDIDKDVMANVYLSQDPYHFSFPETLDLRRFDSTLHPTAGMNLVVRNDRVFLISMSERI